MTLRSGVIRDLIERDAARGLCATDEGPAVLAGLLGEALIQQGTGAPAGCPGGDFMAGERWPARGGSEAFQLWYRGLRYLVPWAA